jgi:hypothetical protein
MLKFMIQTAHHLAILNGTGDQLKNLPDQQLVRGRRSGATGTGTGRQDTAGRKGMAMDGSWQLDQPHRSAND